MSCVRSLQVWAQESRRVRLERRHHDMIPTVTRSNGLPYEKWPRADVSPYYVAEMAGTCGGNRNISRILPWSFPTYSMALISRNHCSLSFSIVLKSLKYSAP